MITKAQIIWSLVATLTGTTAYQAYENHRELVAAAASELSISEADALAELAPPDPQYASPVLAPDDTAGLTGKMTGFLDSARQSLANSNEKSCLGYCDFRRDKCVKMANRDSELAQICEDEKAVCRQGCQPEG